MGTLFTLIFFIILIGQILGKFSELMRQISSTSGQTYRRTRSRKQFTIDDAKFVVQMLAKVARANGRVNEEEARYISRMLDMICSELGSFDYRDRLKAFYNNAKIDDTAIFDIAAEYRMKRNLSQKECISIVIYLLNLAYIDGNFDYHEKAAIEDACKGFGIYGTISDQLFAKFEREFGYQNRYYRESSSYGNSYGNYRDYQRSGYSSGSGYSGGYSSGRSGYSRQNQNRSYTQTPKEKDPYEVLGVSKSASFDEIKKAYRQLARKYHTDFLGTDADENIVSENTKKMQEINAAYEKLKEKFGK